MEEKLDPNEMIIHPGPQHPMLPGPFRLNLKLRGETVVDAEVEHIYRPPVTRMYPEIPTVLSYRFRGLQRLDKSKCMFCGLCIDQCPKGALTRRKEYTKGLVKWKHKDLLMCPDKLAREVDLAAGDER